MRFVKNVDDKDMANGMRNTSGTPLTDREINLVVKQIKRIKADPEKFVFNDPKHLQRSTCYNFADDIVYVTRNVFPDNKYGSTHPRDVMSIAAVLAHEYYGHRPYRAEYLDDYQISPDYHTTPLWQDECRASINAAKRTPGLTEKEKSDLVMDAIYRAKEYGHLIEMDDFMKEVVYGYSGSEKNIVPQIQPIRFVSQPGDVRNGQRWARERDMSEMPYPSCDYDDFER